MLNRQGGKHGYTLIEVLISVAIFGAIVGIATMALDQGLKQYHRLVETGINFWDHAKYLWLNRSFNSMADYYVNTRADGWFPYFVGTQDRISYVTIAPFASEGPVVVWIIKEREEGGSTALVYYEIPVYTMSFDDIERAYVFQDYKKGKSIRLFEHIEDLEVTFYGYHRLKNQWLWTSEFNGNDAKNLPRLVNLTFTDTERHEKKRLVFGVSTDGTARAKFYD